MDLPPPSVRKALGSYEALRRLDFTPDEIFLIVAKSAQCSTPEEHLHLFATVKRNGQEYSIDCGDTDVDAAGLVKWCEAWNSDMTTAERQAIYDEWLSFEFAVHLTTRLELRGFLRKTN